MFTRTRLFAYLSTLLPFAALTQALDPSAYSLNAAGAEKFVRATQQMVAAGVPGPSAQNGQVDLAKAKATIDQNPAAQKALASAGLSSTDYVLFLGAAMQSAMVGQMEAAGMKNMLPPGITKRPPQGNIDFMKSNMDIFQRAMDPKASATPTPATRAAANTSDEALPMPAEAGVVLPSSILAKIPPVSSITAKTDCALPEISATIERETKKATDLQAAYYGNPGNSGLARTPAEGAVLERAGDPELTLCGVPTNWTVKPAEWTAAQAQKDKEISDIEIEATKAQNACPGIPAGKDPACLNAVNATAGRKMNEAELKYLKAMTAPFNAWVQPMLACEAKREAVVKDAKTANVKGANVKLVLRPLVEAWQLPSTPVYTWTGICHDAQRYLQK